MSSGLGAVLLLCGAALAQPIADVPAPGSTVLAPAFAHRLALSRIGWPSAAEQERARDVHTDYARYDAVRWLTRLLARELRPFQPGAPQLARDPLGQLRPKPDCSTRAAQEYARQLTAAISDDGDDVMCARWTTSAYRFQFIAAQQLIRLSVEPVQPGTRARLTAEQTAAGVREFLLNVLNDGSRLLNFCDLQPEPADYGYRVAMRCHDYIAWHQQFQADEQIQNRWFLYLVVHTDGVSFVLDVKPMLSANVHGPGGRPLHRWFRAYPPAATPRPTSAPARDPNEVQAKLRLLKELVDQRKRERQQ